ncbi:MAG: hypothetical protein ACYDH3_05285 [Candidatus Aminicenantales bacterium]
MSEIEFQPGEVELGKWTLNFAPQGGGRYTGTLTVTNQRVLFLAKFATSLGGAIGELIVYKGDYGFLSIPKDRIQKVDVVGGFLKKRVEITLTDGSIHTLDYGLLNVQNIAEAIRKK